MPDIEFTCPRCSQSLIVEESGAGMILQCPSCGIDVTIPSSQSAAEAAERFRIGARKAAEEMRSNMDSYAAGKEPRGVTEQPKVPAPIDTRQSVDAEHPSSTPKLSDRVPFPLQHDERILLDASSVMYFGVGIESIGFSGGKLTSSGHFSGGTYGVQRKLEKSIWNAQEAHVYLTNWRLVVVKAKQSLLTNKEIKLEHVISEMVFDMIVGISVGTKLFKPTLDISVRTPNGETNTLAIVFLTVGGIRRDRAVNKWIDAIRKAKADAPTIVAQETKNSPLEILKLRYAKGEISKQEYEGIKRDLAG